MENKNTISKDEIILGKGHKTLFDLGQLPNGERTTIIEYLNYLKANNLEVVIRYNWNKDGE